VTRHQVVEAVVVEPREAVGAVGVISVAAHWVGPQFRRVVDAFLAGDLATAIDTGSSPDLAEAGGIMAAPALLGSNDIAFVLGTGSTAIAGPDFATETVGSFDLAAVFGDMLHAVATGSNFLVDILPSL